MKNKWLCRCVEIYAGKKTANYPKLVKVRRGDGGKRSPYPGEIMHEAYMHEAYELFKEVLKIK